MHLHYAETLVGPEIFCEESAPHDDGTDETISDWGFDNGVIIRTCLLFFQRRLE